MKYIVVIVLVLGLLCLARYCFGTGEKNLVFIANNKNEIGSGIIIANGYVMTCAHLLGEKPKPEVRLNVFPRKSAYDKHNPKTEIVYVNTDLDILILKVPWAEGSVSFADDIHLGEDVYTYGYTNADLFYFKGYVSHIEFGGSVELDLRASFGASGSGVYNQRGQLVGMVKYVRDLGAGQTVVGIIPASVLQSVLPFTREEPWK